jgi:hypothetical protein
MGVCRIFGSVNHDWLIRFLEHRIGAQAHHPPDPQMAQGGHPRRQSQIRDAG